MPWVYASILVGEVGVLSWLYRTSPPAPSDPLSVQLGWAGLGSMVALLVYSVARRSRGLRQVMRLSFWLHLHIFLAVQAAVLVFFHCYHLFFREHVNVLNPGVLNLLAVGVVFCSGLVGRYLYAWLPRSLGGIQLADREVAQELAAIGDAIPAEVRALYQDAPGGVGILGAVRADWRTRRALRALRRIDLSADQRALMTRKVRLERQRAVLHSAQGVFRYWIILHRPMAGILYVLSAMHVVLSYMFTPSLGR